MRKHDVMFYKHEVMFGELDIMFVSLVGKATKRHTTATTITTLRIEIGRIEIESNRFVSRPATTIIDAAIERSGLIVIIARAKKSQRR